MKANDLTGKIFGRLTVIQKAISNERRRIKYDCKCSCGNTKSVRQDALVSGATVSCGCYNREKSITQIGKCIVAGCENKQVKKHMCAKHFHRHYRNNSTDLVFQPLYTLIDKGFRQCTKCKQVKPISDFNKSLGKIGIRPRCKECNKFRWYWNTYKLTKEAFNTLCSKQDNKCAICKEILDFTTFRRVHVDHCHRTGKIRGICCNNCNHGLGNFKDNIDTLQNAITYLKANNPFQNN